MKSWGTWDYYRHERQKVFFVHTAFSRTVRSDVCSTHRLRKSEPFWTPWEHVQANHSVQSTSFNSILWTELEQGLRGCHLQSGSVTLRPRTFRPKLRKVASKLRGLVTLMEPFLTLLRDCMGLIVKDNKFWNAASLSFTINMGSALNISNYHLKPGAVLPNHWEDWLFLAKSMDVRTAFRGFTHDQIFCKLIGWLSPELRALQHNYQVMKEKVRCVG